MSSRNAVLTACSAVAFLHGAARAQGVVMPRVPRPAAVAEDSFIVGMHYTPEDAPVRWLQDGRIIVVHTEVYNSGDVYSVLCSGSGLYAVAAAGSSPARAVFTGTPLCGNTAVVDARVTRAVYSARVPANMSGIFGLELSTGKVDSMRTGCAVYLQEPQFGPGDSVIAASGMCGSRHQEYEIYLMRRDGSALRRLGGEDSESHEHPTWSPDGTRIAYHRYKGLGGAPDALEIVVSDTAGNGRRVIAHGLQPSWSADGRWIAFLSPTDSTESEFVISVVRPNGGDQRVVFKNAIRTTYYRGYGDRFEGQIRGPFVWSPDGRQLAFARYFDVGASVWVLDIASGSVRQLTRASLMEDWLKH
jgi:hypothetical protein